MNTQLAPAGQILSTESPGMRAVLAAQVAFQASYEANELACQALTAVMRRKFPIGTIIDSSRTNKDKPREWRNISTLRGKDYGTKIFRVESEISVKFNASAPELSMWECEATPISEKTGRDMDGKANRHSTRTTVSLRGSMFSFAECDDLSGDEYKDYCLSKIREFLA